MIRDLEAVGNDGSVAVVTVKVCRVIKSELFSRVRYRNFMITGIFGVIYIAVEKQAT